MRISQWSAIGALALGCAVSAFAATDSEPPGKGKVEEFLLLGDTNRGAGEPVIAINPVDPDNIIVAGMANEHFVEGSPFGSSRKPVGPDTILAYRNTPDASISRYAITHDGGRTWKFIQDPFREFFKMNGTADPFVGAGPDGTLYIGAMAFFPRDPTPEILAQEHEPEPGMLFGGTRLTWSGDKGSTWTHPPIAVMGLDTPRDQYAPGLNPVIKLTTPYDRPYLVSDLSSGTIYIPGTGLADSPPRRQTFFRASRDRGANWSPIYAIDSPAYPQSAFGAGRPTAANGALGVVYIAGKAPGAQCPCLVFGVSRDEGRTIERHVVRDRFPELPGFEEGRGPPSLPMLSADPTRPGRFIVMYLAPGESAMQLHVTDDYGAHWQALRSIPAARGAVMTKPDIAYSPQGDLAVMWLAVAKDQSYTAWSSVLRRGANQFSRPLRISRAPSPPRVEIEKRGNNWDGDDLSSVAVDRQYVHVVWADGRAGFLGSWYARIPLSAY
jgi:hypothetical protein